ncbi:MAG: DUF11 domain-containing protein [Acidimicrobiia bacterium]|nr:DUF11 domain-containing protein [Acidimicrobiia bacterium]
MLSVGGQAQRVKVTRTTSAVLGVLALLLAIVGAQGTASAQAAQASLEVELSMVEGSTYDPSAGGGGVWGDGPRGDPGDVWDEQQWPPSFACDDTVSFMLLVASTSVTGVDPAPRTVQVDLQLDAATSGLPGAGYSKFLGVDVRHDDPGAMTDGGSTASITSEELVGLHQPGGKLYGTVELTDVEVGERIVARVDVLVTCSGEFAGILYGQLHQQGNGQSGFREVAPDGPRDLGAGQNLVQMVQVNGEALGPAEPPTSSTTTTTTSTTSTTTAPGDGPDEPDVGDEGDETTTTTAAPTTSTTLAPDTLTVTKTADRASVAVGGLIRYTITVTNGTGSTVTGIVVEDELIDLEELVGELAPGEGQSLTGEYRATLSDLEVGQVTNVVTVSSDHFDPVTAQARVDVENVLTGVSVLPSGPLTLPRTGNETSRPLWWSAALVAAGLSLLTAARGRRQLDELS